MGRPKKIKAEAPVVEKKRGPKTGGLLPIYQFGDLAKMVGALVKVSCPYCGMATNSTGSRFEETIKTRIRWHFCNCGCKRAFRTEQKIESMA
jgi:hypothetical protein